MEKVYHRFVDMLSGRPGTSELEAAFGAVAGALGLPLFAYLLLPRRGAPPDLISNYPLRWTQHYLARRYDQVDPVISWTLRRTEPFEWGPQTPHAQSGTAQFFDEAAEFGIRYGFTIPIRDRQDRAAAVTFATDNRGPTFIRSIEAYRSGLHLMACFFHRHALAALDPHSRVAGVSLSPRQMECLEWAAQGKSAWETSRIIGVSRRTVSFHLETAKAKLEVRSISQAVAKLMANKKYG